MSDNNKNPQQGGTDTNKKTPNAWGKNKNKKPEGGKENPNQGKRKKFQGGTKGLKEHTFYFSLGMDNKFLHSKEKVINFIRKKFNESKKISIKQNQLTLVGTKKPDQHSTEADVKALKYWEQEQWRIDMKRYSKMTHTLQKNLTTCYSIIWDQMMTGLQNRLKRDLRYKNIHTNQDAMLLFKLLSDVCKNKSTDINHFMNRTMDTLYGVLQAPGNKISLKNTTRFSLPNVNLPRMQDTASPQPQ